MTNIDAFAQSVASMRAKLAEKKKGLSGSEAVEQEKADLDVLKAAQEKALNMETKANEVMWTGNTGKGAEYVPTVVDLDQVVSVMQSGQGNFLAGLQDGFLGTNIPFNSELTIEGEVPFAQGRQDWTTGAVDAGQPTAQMPTDRVNIQKKTLVYKFGVDRYLLQDSIVDVIARLNAGVSEGMNKTAADAVLNGDSSTAGTGNINSDDQAVATTFAATGGLLDRRAYYDDGLRKQVLNGTLNTDFVDVTAVDYSDILSIMSLLRTDVNPGDRMIIMDNGTYYKLMADPVFSDASVAGRASVVSAGAITNINGSDLFVTDLMRLTEADGKISGATPANNTKGQIIVAKKNVIQHGFGERLELQLETNIEKGTLLTAVTDFGFANINKTAGVTAPFIAGGINVTL